MPQRYFLSSFRHLQFDKDLAWEFYAKYPIPGGQGLNNVLALLRPSLELLCHISYLFQRPVPSPSSTFSRGVSLERSLSGFSSLHVIWQERVSKLGPVQSQSIKNFKFILIDPKGFNSETDRSDMALWNLLSSEGKTKHRTMKSNECILLSGPSYLD